MRSETILYVTFQKKYWAHINQKLSGCNSFQVIKIKYSVLRYEQFTNFKRHNYGSDPKKTSKMCLKKIIIKLLFSVHLLFFYILYAYINLSLFNFPNLQIFRRDILMYTYIILIKDNLLIVIREQISIIKTFQKTFSI